MTPPDSCHCWRANALSCGLFTVASSVTWAYTFIQIQTNEECTIHTHKNIFFSTSYLQTLFIFHSFLPLFKFVQPIKDSVEGANHQGCGKLQLLTKQQSMKECHHLKDKNGTTVTHAAADKSKFKLVWVTWKYILLCFYCQVAQVAKRGITSNVCNYYSNK